jgi:hypothetical protein
MKNLLIGSQALSFWEPSLKIKVDTDWDVISKEPIEDTEWHNPEFLLNHELEQYATQKTVQFNGNTLHVVDPIGLAIVKRSHLWRNLSFQKHITHYHKFGLADVRPMFNDLDEMLLGLRTRMTHLEFPQGNPNLNQSVDDFFDDAVTKKYNHDYLHELVAFYSRPLYTQLQHNSTSAWCDRDLWYKLTFDEKIRCVAEETYVISIERFLVPKEWDYPYRLAYTKSLDKVCTTLCSGWFRDFAIDNYPSILGLFNADKINAVKAILEKE